MANNDYESYRIFRDGDLIPFTDPILFGLVMQDPELCRKLIEMIFPERKVKELKYHNGTNDGEQGLSQASKESDLRFSVSGRGVRLDVLFEDEDSVWYDIEMQASRERALSKRIRYNHSMMDVSQLKQGQPFNHLKKSYVLFICTYDPFGSNDPVYYFESRNTKNQLPLGDESYTIVLNSRGFQDGISEDMRAFFDYLNTGEISPGEPFVNSIHERVTEINAREEMRGSMITIEEEMLVQKEYAREEANEAAAKAMKADNVPVEKISQYTGLAVEEITKL